MSKRFLAGATMLAAILMVLPSQSEGAFPDEKAKDIETIMKKLHGGKKGVHKVIAAASKGDPAWEDWAKLAKEYEELAGDLPKNKCPKGDEKSWKDKSEAYAKSAKDLNAAAGKKDKDAFLAAFGKLNGSCKACHDNHK